MALTSHDVSSHPNAGPSSHRLNGPRSSSNDKVPFPQHSSSQHFYLNNAAADDLHSRAQMSPSTPYHINHLDEDHVDDGDDDTEAQDDDDDELSTASGRRHGAILQPEEADMILFESPYMTQWTQKRHQTGGNPKPRDHRDLPDWRMRERLRTVTAALVMCLNIGVDPPDVSKTNPCSKLICWMDPSSIEVSKALPAIGKNLQAQFETLSMKTRYKQYLDPIVEETKRFCTSLRRSAKDERVLFYYNGFGVPKPTPGGEIWVFNKAYTQYIPVTLYDLQAWLGNPCIFVWDASSAGNIVVNFKRMAERRADEEAKAGGSRAKDIYNGTGGDEQFFPLRESIHLAACGPDEVLPMNPDLPADLFTCCLTSPIEISLRWFVLQNPLPSQLNVDMVMNIPGRLQDRRTPLGELNWIFTAITDTIAWTVLPRAIFRRLFRDDLMVAALLRNFLLAERIMRFYHCTPMSHPKLPPTHNHPLWNSWDLAVDQCLSQLPTLLAKEAALKKAATPNGPSIDPHLASFEYRHSTFFSEQLMAFEVWLSQGGVSRKGRRRKAGAQHTTAHDLEVSDDDDDDDDQRARTPPDQLPIVLQVLLSQVHRLRALILLSQFLDLGPWAVNMALSIGIFPYVLKLLQSPAADLKPVLIYIWARILAVDRSCQNDLLRDNGFAYFTVLFSPFQQGQSGDGVGGANPNSYPIPNVSEHRAMCAFILSVFCLNFPAGQQACLQTDALDSCLEHLDDDDFLLRQWSALCIGQLWDNSPVGKARGIAKDVHGKLACMLSDISPEVRAAILYTLGILLGASGSSYDPSDPTSSLPANAAQHKHSQTRPPCLGTGSALGLDESKHRSLEVGIAITMLTTKGDSSPLVRKELVIALSPLVREYQGFFVLAAFLYYHREQQKSFANSISEEDAARVSATPVESYEEGLLTRILTKLSLEEGIDEIDISNVPAFVTLFVSLLDLSADSHPEVASMASTVVDYITALLITSLPSEFLAPTGPVEHLVNPTSTVEQSEGYFPQISRSKINAGIDNDQTSLGIGSGHPSPGSRPDSRNSLQPGMNRRSTSLAQTVKAIATLGYSRPPSPSHASPEYEVANGNNTFVPPKSAYLPARVPAPRQNSARYMSPFAPSKNSESSEPNSPHTPNVDLNAASTSTAAHRSASAESLAYIARLQDKRNLKASSSSQPSTPSLAKSPLAERLGSLGMTPAGKDDIVAAGQGPDQSPMPSLVGSQAHTPNIEQQSDVKLADALVAIVALDLQRFHDRAQIAENFEMSSAGHTPMHSPSTTRTHSTPGTPSSVGNGLGSRSLREVLPLKSKLFAWCSEYYREPQMKCAEADEPGSVQYNIQTWKRERNERLISEAQADVDNVQLLKWTESPYSPHTTNGNTQQSVASGVQVGSPSYLMRFHQFENHLVSASEQDTLSVWDWTSGKLLSRIHNGNPPRTSITSLAFANEDAQTRLLVGSADGDVRIYANYDEPCWKAGKGPKLVSSMRALPHLIRSKRPSGLIMDWQQISGSLLVGGDSRSVRIWDAHRELCVCDVPTWVPSCVTSISSETDIGHIFVCGFGNGTIATYDRRNPPETSLVRMWREHPDWISNVHLQKRSNRELVSAGTDGTVKVWDLRVLKSLKTKNWSSELHGKLSAMDVHDGAGIFALSSYPKPQRLGYGPQRTLICDIDSQEVLDHFKPIVRHFATNNHPSSYSGAHSSMPNQPAVSTTGHMYHHNYSQQSVTTLSQAIDTPPSSYRPAMGSLAFHPHFPLLAFGGPDTLGFVGLTRAHLVGGAHGLDGLHSSPHTSFLPPYSTLGYGHGAPGILDGDDQRHIPTFDDGTHERSRAGGLFRF